MKPEDIRSVLESVKRGDISIDKALHRLKTLPLEDIGFATLDHHRSLRKGFPEVIWGAGKTSSQILTIIKNMLTKKHPILVTRVDSRKAAHIKKALPAATYHPASRLLTLNAKTIPKRGKGTILVISAGTSDIPVAEEALITASIMGNTVGHLYDVGVAGIHRLVEKKDAVQAASVLIVVAGMEGALPSVIGGLVDKPIIAVPTSTGYGTGFGGIAALLSMLNSCASGIAVVNIDNGFGAGYIASLINSV
jgi:NCAIR mutase (PurE)-related protein